MLINIFRSRGNVAYPVLSLLQGHPGLIESVACLAHLAGAAHVDGGHDLRVVLREGVPQQGMAGLQVLLQPLHAVWMTSCLFSTVLCSDSIKISADSVVFLSENSNFF